MTGNPDIQREKVRRFGSVFYTSCVFLDRPGQPRSLRCVMGQERFSKVTSLRPALALFAFTVGERFFRQLI